MEIFPLSIPGVIALTPRQFPDERGVFLESFRADLLAEHTGHEMRVLQSNVSVSSPGTVRGIHFAHVPPGQAKYITVTNGALIDYVVDLRLGSPTFGTWEQIRLDDVTRKTVYIPEGVGHAFCALKENTTALYLCSATYNPDKEFGIAPLDPEIGLELPEGITPLLSPKDAAAPSLQEAISAGLLNTYEECHNWEETLKQRHQNRPQS